MIKKAIIMDEKVIMITGANGAIGSFLTEEYLKSDYKVIAFIHKNRKRIDHLLDLYPRNLVIRECDLNNYLAFTKELASLDYDVIPTRLIHTTALRSSDFLPLADTNPELWTSIVNTNLLNTYNLLRGVIPYLQKKQEGRIVLLGSNISRTGLKFGSAYAASKGALASLARSVALEYGQDNILINVLSPGPVDADQSHFSEDYRKFRAEYFAKELEETPLKKLVNPRDIFDTCNFLLSEKNRLISGEEIYITGGKL